MLIDHVLYIKIFTGVLSIINPLGAVPVFLSLTAEQTRWERNRVAGIVAVTTAAVLLAAAVFGESVLGFFGISIGSFRVGGGILILLIAISMLHARISAIKHAPEEVEEAATRDSIAVVPLAIPLLAGPGAISTVILYSHQAGLLDKAILCVIILAIAVITWIILKLATPIGAFLGTTGINIVGRLMGLILAAIAVEFIAGGIKELFPAIGAVGL